MNTALIGIGVVGAFAIWKFIIEPRMNEDQPIEPPKDHKTFEKKMQESMNTNVDF